MAQKDIDTSNSLLVRALVGTFQRTGLKNATVSRELGVSTNGLSRICRDRNAQIATANMTEKLLEYFESKLPGSRRYHSFLLCGFEKSTAEYFAFGPGANLDERIALLKLESLEQDESNNSAHSSNNNSHADKDPENLDLPTSEKLFHFYVKKLHELIDSELACHQPSLAPEDLEALIFNLLKLGARPERIGKKINKEDLLGIFDGFASNVSQQKENLEESSRMPKRKAKSS